MKHAQTVFKNFLKHDCFYLASHISFCALLSLIPLILIAISIVVISLFFFLPTAADLLTRALTRFGFHFPLGEILRGKPFYFLFSTFAFVFIIVVIPHHRVRLRYAVFGGLFFAAVILLAKQWFRWYFLRAFDQYNLIYGSLTALVDEVVLIKGP